MYMLVLSPSAGEGAVRGPPKGRGTDEELEVRIGEMVKEYKSL